CDDVGVAEVLALAPELERHEDEQAGLETGGQAAVHEAGDEVARGLCLEAGDLLDVHVREQRPPPLVQDRDEPSGLGAEGLAWLMVCVRGAQFYGPLCAQKRRMASHW